MNAKKFLALKLAEAAYELGEQAEHVAANHTDGTDPDTTCESQLVKLAITIVEVSKIAMMNRLGEPFTRDKMEEIRADVRRSIANESLREGLNGNLTGVILF